MPVAKRNKHIALIRKLCGKFLRKLGSQYVRKITPQKHIPLLDYIERARRKRENKAKKAKLMALLGKEEAPEVAATQAKAGEDSDSDDEMDSGDDQHAGADAEEKFSDNGSDDESGSDSESEEEDDVRGADMLMTDGVDIPRVDNIPIVSKLAKEKKLEAKSKLTKVADTRDKVKQLMQADAEEYESHFVENPFIKMRERALQKSLDGKMRLGAKHLLGDGDADMDEEDAAMKQDIVLVKESGKFIINDLELEEMKMKKAAGSKLTGKRARMELAKDHEESDDDASSQGDNVSDSESE